MALTVDDFKDVQSALWEARSQWFNIGVQLGLKVTDLNAIDREPGLDLKGKFRTMILSWLQHGNKCTWRELRKALKHCTVDLPELAYQMKTNYGFKESGDESTDDETATTDVSLKENTTSVDNTEESSVPHSHDDAAVSLLLKNYQRMLHVTLYKDSKKMNELFSTLASKTEDVLIENNISVDRLVSCISPCSDDTNKSAPLIEDQLHTAQSVSRVFIILKSKRLISFINYKIMVPIIKNLCKNEELTEELKTYEAHFREYVKRRVCEASVYKSGRFEPGMISSLAEGDDLLIITDHSWSAEKSVQEILDLNIVVAEIFKLKDFALALQSAEPKCLRLHYYVSNGVGRMIFPLTHEQKDKLRKCGITEVHYKEYHYVLGNREVEDDPISMEEDIHASPAVSKEAHEEDEKSLSAEQKELPHPLTADLQAKKSPPPLFPKPKANSTQALKITAKKKETSSNPPLPGLHLKFCYNVTLAQVNILTKHLEVLRHAMEAGPEQRHKANEAVKEIRDATSELAHRLHKSHRAVVLLQPPSGSRAGSTTGDETSTLAEMSPPLPIKNKEELLRLQPQSQEHSISHSQGTTQSTPPAVPPRRRVSQQVPIPEPPTEGEYEVLQPDLEKEGSADSGMCGGGTGSGDGGFTDARKYSKPAVPPRTGCLQELGMAASNDPSFQFRKVVADAAQRLSVENRERLVYIYQLPPDNKEMSGLSILANLQMRREFSSENPETLVEVLKAADRPDLAKDIEKQVKKWQKGKKKEKKMKTISAPVQVQKEKTVWLKARFDEIVEQTAQLVDQVAKLREQLELKGEGRHKKANDMLIRCEEEADKLQRSLRHVRSAGKLGDRALQAEAELQKQLNAAVRRVSMPMREKVENVMQRSSIESPPAHIATPVLGQKEPLHPPQSKQVPCAPAAPQTTDQERSTGSPEVKRQRSVKGSVPTPRNGAQKKQSDVNSPPTKIPVQRHHSCSSRQLSEGSENLYINVVYHESSDSDYTGSGGTGDSGFGDTTPFLKEPLTKPHNYMPLLPEHHERYEAIPPKRRGRQQVAVPEPSTEGEYQALQPNLKLEDSGESDMCSGGTGSGDGKFTRAIRYRRPAVPSRTRRRLTGPRGQVMHNLIHTVPISELPHPLPTPTPPVPMPRRHFSFPGNYPRPAPRKRRYQQVPTTPEPSTDKGRYLQPDLEQEGNADSGMCSGGTGSGDGGFTDARRYRKPAVPPRTVRQESPENGQSYLSLERSTLDEPSEYTTVNKTHTL